MGMNRFSRVQTKIVDDDSSFRIHESQVKDGVVECCFYKGNIVLWLAQTVDCLR